MARVSFAPIPGSESAPSPNITKKRRVDTVPHRTQLPITPRLTDTPFNPSIPSTDPTDLTLPPPPTPLQRNPSGGHPHPPIAEAASGGSDFQMNWEFAADRALITSVDGTKAKQAFANSDTITSPRERTKWRTPPGFRSQLHHHPLYSTELREPRVQIIIT